MKLEKVVFTVLVLLIGTYFSALFFLPGNKVVFYLKPLFVPLFLVYAILKNGFVFPKPYFYFVLFFYLGQTFMLFSDNSGRVLQLALVFYVMFYFALINLSLPLIRGKHFKTVFTKLTTFVILLNAFFLFLIVYIMFETATDIIVNYIAIFNATAALALMICAVVYLSSETDKKSFLYFCGAITLILSDVFSAINVYYINVFTLNILEIILHFGGFYLIYLFVIEKGKPDEIDF
ncbi:hypothetical protein [Flavobacterium sp.]|uniref:hypothetical protein n=1 Tax=Flavobacterium sp. TaxID=239 RepID=UPI002487FBCF|nr:hypothetical protein [Flavobacterium sp.]MDI1316951.1 hypothetical protein [Flavobacterium sp.]